jgi:hypothetical protein
MNTLWSCENQGDSALKFIDVKTIQSVVAMIPHSKPAMAGQQSDSESDDRFFLVEKPGLDVAIMAGVEEELPAEEGEADGNSHVIAS